MSEEEEEMPQAKLLSSLGKYISSFQCMASKSFVLPEIKEDDEEDVKAEKEVKGER